jgi:hypothetical protein
MVMKIMEKNGSDDKCPTWPPGCATDALLKALLLQDPVL